MQHSERKDRSWRNEAGMAAAAAALLILAGCSGKTPEASASTSAAPTEEASVPASIDTPSEVATGSGPDLSVYVGKYPLDKVGAHAFFDDPTVVSGVAAAIGDPKVAAAIAGMKGPVGPVKLVDGDIAASRCELHNCGAHNYAVHVDAKTNQVSSVCYYDEKAGPIATWYKPDGSKTSEGGGCSVG